MRKVLYKDEVFYVDFFKHPTFKVMPGSHISIWRPVKRGWLSRKIRGDYEHIKTHGTNDDGVDSREFLEMCLEDAWLKEKGDRQPPIIIKCSPEIRALFEEKAPKF